MVLFFKAAKVQFICPYKVGKYLDINWFTADLIIFFS